MGGGERIVAVDAVILNTPPTGSSHPTTHHKLLRPLFRPQSCFYSFSLNFFEFEYTRWINSWEWQRTLTVNTNKVKVVKVVKAKVDNRAMTTITRVMANNSKVDMVANNKVDMMTNNKVGMMISNKVVMVN